MKLVVLDGFTMNPGESVTRTLAIDAAQNSFVAVRMAVDRAAVGGQRYPRATLYYATAAAHGLHSFRFPVDPDGLEHAYNLDLLDASDWRGKIIALGIGFTRPAAMPMPRWLKVSSTPPSPRKQ